MDTRTPLFLDTVVRKAPGLSGIVFLMNRPDAGWECHALPFQDVAEVERLYQVKVGPWSWDQHGECAPVTRLSALVDA